MFKETLVKGKFAYARVIMINHNVNVLRNTCFVIVLRILPIACVVICMDELF